MATTNSAFVKNTNAVLVGATVAAAGQVNAINAANAAPLVSGGYATRLDADPNADLSVAGYAKNGACAVNLTGTTAVTLSLADLTSASTSSAGDTVFATWNKIIFRNTGAADVTVAPAGSNPASILLAGTSPTLTVPANSLCSIMSAAGVAVDGTHKGITITPTAGGSFAMVVGGA